MQWAAVLLLSSLNHRISTLCAQGSLTPPGPPAPTMKTLTQIEPRTPISSVPFTITNPGSYYLTGNLTGLPSQGGITISTNDVTLDLNGFALLGLGSGTGVEDFGAVSNISVANGSVQNWSVGVGFSAEGVQLSRLRVSHCGGGGINVGSGSVVSDCLTQANGSSGFSGGDHITFTDCTSVGNAESGFDINLSCLFISCIAQKNGQYGFFPDNNCVFRDCIADGNAEDGIFATPYANCLFQNCSASANGAETIRNGISAGPACVVRGCTASGNGGTGIDAVNGVVENCTATGNVLSGISSTGGIIQGCWCSKNDGGIEASAGCVIAHCTSTGNTGNGINATGCVVENCILTSNNSDGIDLYGPGSVSGCLVANNTYIGISVYNSGFQVLGNTCVSNKQYGIVIEGNAGRVEGNHVLTLPTQFGIEIFGSSFSNNVVVRNSVTGASSSDYSTGAGNDIGPIGVASSVTSPWANIQH